MLELLVVMAIIAVIAGLVMPRISTSFANLKLKAGARGCSAILRNARSLAITTRRKQTVTFQLTNHPRKKSVKVVSCQINTEGKGKKFSFSLQEGIAFYWKERDEGWVRLSEEVPTYEIFFDHRGFNSGGDLKLSYFKNSEDVEPFLEYTLRLDPITGRVRVGRVD